MAKKQPDLRIDREFQRPSGGAAVNTTTTIGVLAAHAISGVYHTGTLTDAQAPQFLKLDGTRPLTGNLSVTAGITIDGVDVSVHAANVNAHHARSHSLTSTSDHTATGSQYDVLGLSATNTIGILTPSISPGVSAKLLRTHTTGKLTLQLLDVTGDVVIGNGATGKLVIGSTGWEDTGSTLELLGSDTVDLNAAEITSTNGDTQYLLGRAALGYVGIAAYAGFASRGHETSTEYAVAQNTGDGSLHLNRSNAAVMYFKEANVQQARFEDDAFIFSSPMTMKADNYASQTTGWGITYTGSGDFRYLFTDELHAKSFIADLEQALAGGQIIAKSVAVLAVAFTAPAAAGTATLRVKDLPSAANMACFQSGDIVRLRQFTRASGSLTIADCWGVVTSYADQSDGTQTWTFTRSSGGNAGAMSTSTVVNADSIVLDYGTTGNGFYEVNAIDGAYAVNSPYSQIVTWTTHPHTGKTVNVRLGNLTGLGFTDEFGLYAQGASNSEYIKATGAGILTRNLSYNAYNSSTHTMEIQPDGDFFIGSNIGAVATTTLAVFGANRTYDSEAVTAGDIVIGDHTGANAFWDISAGQLKFRDSTSTKCYINTTGEFTSGGGDVVQGSDGFNIGTNLTTSPVHSKSLSWWIDITSRGGDPISEIYTRRNAVFNSHDLAMVNYGQDATYHQGLIALTAVKYDGSQTNTLLIFSNGEAEFSENLSVDGILSDSTYGGWHSLTPATGWANEGGGLATLAIKMFGDLVLIKGRVTYSSGGTANIVNLAAAYRPSEDLTVACWTNVGGVIALREVRIRANGDVGAAGWTPASGDKISLDGSTYFL